MIHDIHKKRSRTGARRWAATLVSIGAAAAVVTYSGGTVYPSGANAQGGEPTNAAATARETAAIDYYPALFPEPQGQAEAPIPTF